MTMLSVYACAIPFVGFWDYDMVVSSVQVQSRAPSFEEKSLVVIDFKTNNLDIFKSMLWPEWWTWLAILEF